MSQRLDNEIATHLKTKDSMTTRAEFLAIVSHDLRNAISAISSCSEMLLNDDNFSKMNPEMKTWLEFVKRNSDSALFLVRDIVEVERISFGKLNLQLELQNMSQLINDSLKNFISLAHAKNIELKFDCAENISPVYCDRERILQVLGNLIGNAIKFTQIGGLIILGVKLANDCVSVSIMDNRPVIARDKQDHIFERFTQIGLPDRRGLGLGLYISKMLIEAHHDRIWVDSELTKGSTFWFSIPLKSPKFAACEL